MHSSVRALVHAAIAATTTYAIPFALAVLLSGWAAGRRGETVVMLWFVVMPIVLIAGTLALASVLVVILSARVANAELSRTPAWKVVAGSLLLALLVSVFAWRLADRGMPAVLFLLSFPAALVGSFVFLRLRRTAAS
jgi:hypothetical protein